MTASRENDAGFTLIELLVSMTLLALLVLALGSGLHFGLRAWERSEAHGSGMDEVRLVQDLLRRELERAYPAYDASGPRLIFAGGRDTLSFLAPAPAAASGRTGLALSYQSGTLVLTAAGHREVLLDRLAAFHLSYFGSDRPAAAPAWHASWSGHTALPELIRIEASFAPGDARRWPELDVSPHILVDASCDYDDATHGCRGRR